MDGLTDAAGLQEMPVQSSRVVDSQEKAEGIVMRLDSAVENLRLCMNTATSTAPQSLRDGRQLPPEISNSMESLVEDILRFFVQVQSFEGESHSCVVPHSSCL